ncbi:IclR family transcriptional regulator [Leucobacter allii]|uniref:IclR family transcriptional regulator n=1 Tax=Leucobacter allii TaxID=2932247 RepID=UPI001FD59E54|nr:IclR family transcriptional regulator [Leucobacter allii]UOR01795.1 IclR family transcriptional regulator [Leucobacter allii]
MDIAADEHVKKRTAAGRVLSLLDAFLRGGGALRLTDISRYADLPLPTAHRLVRELLEWGGLEQDEEGCYRLSGKFLRLASSSTRGLEIREHALPHLIALHRSSGQAVQLAVRDGRDIVYLEALRTHPNWSGEARIGGRLPLHVSAAGLVLLAGAGPDVLDDYLSRPLKRYTEHTPVDPDAIRAAVARIRQDKAMIAEHFITHDAGGVGVPVTNGMGETIAAVGLIYFSEKDRPQALLDMVRVAAWRISRAICERPGQPDPRTVDFKRRHAGLL